MDAADRPTSQARRLAKVLVMQSDEERCERCLEGLEEYVEAQLAGEAYAASYPTIAAHLDSCVACAESYALIYEARLAEQQGHLPSPATIPKPDLSFLPLPRLRQTLPAALARAVISSGGRLKVVLSRALLELLPPPSGPALALRGAAERPLHLVELERPAPQLTQLRIAIYQTEPRQASVQVSVLVEGREWPDLGDIPVRLSAGAEAWLARTDAWGQASFDGVPAAMLDGLQVEVEI